MPRQLSSEQVASYARDGFLSPVAALDRFGHFELERAPTADLDEAARAAYERSYDGYRTAYAEQVSREAPN